MIVVSRSELIYS